MAALTLVTLAAGQAPMTGDAAAPPEVPAWIRANAIPIRAVDSGGGVADLEPLRSLVGDARIVALGEATHGTREFVQFNHRLTEWLVTKLGFSLFAIEGPASENAAAVNDYVLHGRGDAMSALEAWRAPARATKEMLDLIEWMRRYNQDSNHTKKVRFLGFNLFPADAARSDLTGYLRRVDPAFAERAAAIFRETPAVSFRLEGSALARLESVRNRLAEKQAEYTSLGGKQAWELAERRANAVLQWVQGQDRDCHSAENLRRILSEDGPDSKMIIYAHNGHVADHRWLGSVLTCKPMGGELRKVFGKRMLTIGSAFHEGSAASGDRTTGGGGQIRVFAPPPAPRGTLGGAFAAAGLPMFLLDMRRAPAAGPAGDWFGAPVPEYIMAGAVEDARKPAGVVTFREPLRDRYDAVFFAARSSEPRPARRLTLAPVETNSLPRNLDFEEVTGPTATGWSIPAALKQSGYNAAASDEQPNSGMRCAVLSGPATAPGSGTGALDQGFDGAPYRGKLVRFRASIRAGGENSRAYLYMRVDRAHLPGFYGNTRRTPAAPNQWRQFEIVGRVAEDAYSVHIGIALEGGGKAWIDSASFEVVSE